MESTSFILHRRRARAFSDLLIRVAKDYVTMGKRDLSRNTDGTGLLLTSAVSVPMRCCLDSHQAKDDDDDDDAVSTRGRETEAARPAM